MARLAAFNLAKSYGRRRVVVDVSLQVDSGQIVGLLGPNGAGKTTCFYMLAGLVRGSGGRILLDETEITRAPMHVRARLGLGYLPQEASVFRKLSVADNLRVGLEAAGVPKTERKARLEQLLAEFNLGGIRGSLGIALSGGERRRVEIARALAVDPRFMLLDEPFAGVDPVSVGEIKQIVEQLRTRDIGVLITDHNVRETLSLCDLAYIVGEGRIIAAGTASEILADPQVRSVYLGDDFRL
ncbi:MAG: LPS export ABC transporter ATP-binding protein [Cellvibrionales bacterium]|nr:LPS export ABC transporter ATP-binding protein [Cellvibrionales bacterium]